MMKFNVRPSFKYRPISLTMSHMQVQINMEMSRGQLESKAIQARDKAEIRDLLQHIVQSTEDMRTLLNMSSRDSRPVEVMMESLQTVCIIPDSSHSQIIYKIMSGINGPVFRKDGRRGLQDRTMGIASKNIEAATSHRLCVPIPALMQ